MLNVINLTPNIIREKKLEKMEEILPIASLPDRNQVLYRVATTEDKTENFVILGGPDGPPDGPCLMFSLEGMRGINPELNIDVLE